MHLILDNQAVDAVVLGVTARPALLREAAEKIRRLEESSGRRPALLLVTAPHAASWRVSFLGLRPDGLAMIPGPPEALCHAIEDAVLPIPSSGRRPGNGIHAMDDLIDREEMLARVDGDLELLCELVGIFLDDCPRLMAQIESAVTQGDGDALERSAHALKGSVSNFTTKSPYEAAFRLETMGRARDLGQANEVLVHLKHEMERLKPVLSSLGQS
jgi:HPt (histidine-containing phosphotransfer) domain-containing protein